jgi:hypothetical protein
MSNAIHGYGVLSGHGIGQVDSNELRRDHDYSMVHKDQTGYGEHVWADGAVTGFSSLP